MHNNTQTSEAATTGVRLRVKTSVSKEYSAAIRERIATRKKANFFMTIKGESPW